MTTLQIKLPEKLVPVFTGPADVRGAFGGRGSAKTRSFTSMTAVYALNAAQAGENGVILCGRARLNSLEESSLAEVKAAIAEEPTLASHFDVGEKYVRTRPHLPGRVDYVFAGLTQNLGSIKSKARILVALVEEAEEVGEDAWSTLIPTIREEGSELWVIWNPAKKGSATDLRFRQNPPASSRIVELNWRDNPWFPEKLNRVRLEDKEKRPEQYGHVWEGEYLSTHKNALWKPEFIRRLSGELPDMRRVVVSVDPSGADGTGDGDSIGIIAAGHGVDGLGYVFADRTCNLSPEGWARQAVRAFDEFDADRVVAETNFGGDMVRATVRSVRRSVPYKAVRAARGKVVRAEPIASLYEQGRVVHCGVFADLEAEMYDFTTAGYIGDHSPNRVDALVWALTELMPSGVEQPEEPTRKRRDMYDDDEDDGGAVSWKTQ